MGSRGITPRTRDGTPSPTTHFLDGVDADYYVSGPTTSYRIKYTRGIDKETQRPTIVQTLLRSARVVGIEYFSTLKRAPCPLLELCTWLHAPCQIHTLDGPTYVCSATLAAFCPSSCSLLAWNPPEIAPVFLTLFRYPSARLALPLLFFCFPSRLRCLLLVCLGLFVRPSTCRFIATARICRDFSAL